jgi:transposase
MRRPPCGGSRTGCAWRYLLTDFPPWQTIYGYPTAWRDNGILARLNLMTPPGCRRP